MNGVRSTFMRRGYLLTALSALLLLAASAGTAEAQRVSIGFVETSGEVSEKAFLNVNSLTEPQKITVRVSGLLPGAQRTGDIGRSLGNITITPSRSVFIARVTAGGDYVGGGAVANPLSPPALSSTPFAIGTPFTVDSSHFTHSDEVVLVVAQSTHTGATAGDPDPNWVSERVELQLEVQDANSVSSPASVSPDIYTLTVMDTQAQPVAKFLQPNFKLSESSQRAVVLDVASGRLGVPIPAAAATAFADTNDLISIRVSNHDLVALDNCPTGRSDPDYNRKLFYIQFDAGEWTEQNFSNTGVLQTAAAKTIGALADNPATPSANVTANMTIHGCGDGAGIRDPYISLAIMETKLVGQTTAHRTNGNFAIGPPLMISIDSDEAAPTLSFSPTDVTIDEGGSVESVLLAEGPNASAVRTVKLMVEGDAMVDLYQGDEMLEEMNGYVTVDLGGNGSARLMAMSMEDRELADGDMAYKAWKLVEGETDGAHIGEDSRFKVDVVGMTAVPALPLIGQLLLALFLMAGGSRLYRRRRG